MAQIDVHILNFRFQKQIYFQGQIKVIQDSLNDISSHINGCIEFYDDTKELKYKNDYLLIQGTKNGSPWIGCSSSAGFTPTTSGVFGEDSWKSYQPINLAYYCVDKVTIQHEVMHALGCISKNNDSS